MAVIQLSESLAKPRAADVLARQILRSAASVGAKSAADMPNKLMELLKESKPAPDALLDPLIKETDEIVAMTVAAIKTLRAKNPKPTRINLAGHAINIICQS